MTIKWLSNYNLMATHGKIVSIFGSSVPGSAEVLVFPFLESRRAAPRAAVREMAQVKLKSPFRAPFVFFHVVDLFMRVLFWVI